MKHLLSCVFAVFLFAGVAVADEISLVTDVWPPFTDEAGENPGYMVEVAQKIFTKNGHTITYETMAWSRAVKITRAGKKDAIVGAAVGDAEDFVFHEEALGQLENYFFVRKDSDWKYENIDSLKTVKVGVILDYDYGAAFMEYMNANKGSGKIDIMGGDDPLKKNILKLKAKRIDTMIEVKPVFDHTVKEMGVADLFKSAGSDGEADPVYIAFSPKNPKSKEYAKILSDGIKEMRQSGELATILAKYGQKDWK